MRRGLLWLLLPAAVAALVWVAAATPLGRSAAARLIERTLRERTDLELAIGSLEGNLLRRIRIEDLSLRDPNGTTIARVGAVTAAYDALALIRRRIVIPELVIDDAHLLFDVGPDGRPVGWSRFAIADTAAAAGSSGLDGWTIDADLHIEGLNATARDTARGYRVDITGLGADAAGGLDAYEGTVAGSVRVGHTAIAEPFGAVFEVELVGSGASLDLTSLVRSDVARAAAAAELGFSEAGPGRRGASGDGAGSADPPRITGGRVDADLSLDELGRLLGAPGIGGDARIEGSFAGPADSLGYRLAIASERVAYDGTELSGLEAEVAGDPFGGRLERFEASLADGALTAAASWVAERAESGFGAAVRPPHTPVLAVEAELRNADLAVLARGADGAAAAGRLDVELALSADALDATGFVGSGQVRVAGLVVGAREPGDLVAEFGIDGALATGRGSCCGTEFDVDVALTRGGIDSVGFVARIADLGVPGAVAGVPALKGRGEILGTVLRPVDDATVHARANFPDFIYRDIHAGPVTVDVSGRSGVYEYAVGAFSGAVTAGGRFRETGGAHETTVRVEGLALERAVGDSIRDLLGLSGSVSAGAVVRGDTSGTFSAHGAVSALAATVGGESMALERPASFRATRDSGVAPVSVTVDEFALAGTLGRFAVSGGMEDSLGVAVVCEGADLAAALALVPESDPTVLPRGLLDGSFGVAGSLSAPRFTADATISDLGVGDIDIGSLACDVETQGSDVVFAVDVRGTAGGRVSSSGLVPLLTDTTGVVGVDRAREFAVSVACSSFTLDAGEWLLPDVRGRKTIRIDGSALVTGRGDSLSTLNGGGSFDRVDVRFEAVEFRLTDPVGFLVAGGDTELDTLRVAVIRRRVLGSRAGGSFSASGRFARDGRLAAALSADSLEVGTLVRAFAPRAGDALDGKLGARATILGTPKRPEYAFSWAMERPSIYGVGFERLEGSGFGDARSVTLDNATLAAGAESLTVSGTIPLPPPAAPRERGARSRPPRDALPAEFDLTIRADRFRLDAIDELPPEIGEVEGALDVDLSIGGPVRAPRIEGAATLRDGAVRAPGLARLIGDARFDVQADGETIVLTDGSVRLGSGAVTFSGFTQLGEDGVFWASADLESAEIGVEDMFEATLGGEVTWTGTPAASRVAGDVVVEEAEVSYSVGLDDVMRRRRPRVVLRRSDNPMAAVRLDLDASIRDRVLVRSNVARADLSGGFHIDGTALVPRVSGSVTATEGSFSYLDNEFALELLSVRYVDPRRPDPYVELAGVAEVESRDGDLYTVAVRFDDFLLEGIPDLTSDPPLSQPDIVSLLTFGDTFGGFMAGGEGAGSSGDRFTALARTAFVSSVFGIAESTLERLLRLDTVALDEEAFEESGIVGSDVTIGKEFGDRLLVQYTTPLGRFEEREVEVALRLTRMLSIETRADPEGNHAVGLKLRVPFR